MINSCRLYYNTGFKVGDIPDKVSLLNSASYMDVDGHWDLQDFFVSELRLKITWNNIENADYIKFGDAYYWITGKNMVNQNMCIISLQLDALTSMGGATELSYIAGRINRAHPSATDEESINTLPESIVPQNPLVAKKETLNYISSFNTKLSFLASTVKLNLNIAKDEAGHITNGKSMALPSNVNDAETGEPINIIIPQSTEVAPATKFRFGASGIGADKEIGYGLYTYSTGDVNGRDLMTRNNMEYMISLGLTGSLLFIYAPWCAGIDTDAVSHVSLLGGGGTTNSLELQFGNYTPRYRKTKYMYRSFTLVGTLTGSSKDYEAHDVCENDIFTVKIDSDPQPDGKMYMYPAKFQGSQPLFNSGVCSANWVKIPVSSNTSGLAIADNQYGLAVQSYITKDVNFQEQMALAKSSNRMGAIAGSLSGSFINNSAGMQSSGPGTNGEYAQGYQASVAGFNPLAPISGAIMGFHNEMTVQPAQQRMHDNSMAIDKLNIKYDKAMARLQLPNLSCAPASGLALYDIDQFAIYQVAPSERDMQRIDDYFDQYGYSMDIKFDKSYMSNRQNFNYLATEDVRIARTHGSLMLRELAENQLNNGVRIWHTLPNNN